MADKIGPERAKQWYDELMVAVRSLEKFPNRALLAPKAAEFELDIRQLFVGKGRQYRILFLVEKGRVSIFYVRHSSQSWLERQE